MSDEENFQVGEKVLCWDGPLIYEAKCLEVRQNNGELQYYIHYHRWNKNWDQWVGVSEERLLKYNDANVAWQKEVNEAWAIIYPKSPKKKTPKKSPKKTPQGPSKQSPKKSLKKTSQTSKKTPRGSSKNAPQESAEKSPQEFTPQTSQKKAPTKSAGRGTKTSKKSGGDPTKELNNSVSSETPKTSKKSPEKSPDKAATKSAGRGVKTSKKSGGDTTEELNISVSSEIPEKSVGDKTTPQKSVSVKTKPKKSAVGKKSNIGTSTPEKSVVDKKTPKKSIVYKSILSKSVGGKTKTPNNSDPEPSTRSAPTVKFGPPEIKYISPRVSSKKSSPRVSQKRTQLPRRRRLDFTDEEVFPPGKVLNINIPNELKRWIIDDYILVTKERMLNYLPAVVSVEKTFENYIWHTLFGQDDALTENEESKIIELVNGFVQYFNDKLATQLLYDFEKPQYARILQAHPETPMSQLYGLIHLLRLVWQLNVILPKHFEEKDIQLIDSQLKDFFEYVLKDLQTFHSELDYDPAPEDYPI